MQSTSLGGSQHPGVIINNTAEARRKDESLRRMFTFKEGDSESSEEEWGGEGSFSSDEFV